MDRGTTDADRFPARPGELTRARLRKMELPIEREVIPGGAPRTPAAPAPEADTAPVRAWAVDALRGLAFLAVVLGGTKPYGVLPAWMYHAQEPPPTHDYNPAIAGLTYPDLVLPFFLFTMGVAIPLALTRRMERGAGLFPVLRHGVAARFALLMFLALFRQHFDSAVWPVLTHKPEQYAWVLGLLGFGVLFAIFTRPPSHWSRKRRLALRTAGWSGAILMFAFTQFPEGTSLRPSQLDPILVINAYCVALGTLVWLATRRQPMARLAIVAFIAAIRMNYGQDGWLNDLASFRIPGVYSFTLLQYLCITVPGTIIGDLFVTWSRAPRFDGARTPLFVPADAPLPIRTWSNARVITVGLLLILCMPLLLVGIQSRMVFVTTAVAALFCTAAVQLTRNGSSVTEGLVSQLVRWGTFWLMLGLLLDPVEGGTYKEPATFAWMFQGLGLATCVLTVFVIIVNVFHRRGPLQLLIDNGQNPMMGYVGYGMLMLPLLGLSGIKNLVESREPGPWAAFAWSVLVMLVVAHIVQFFTRRKLFWRT